MSEGQPDEPEREERGDTEQVDDEVGEVDEEAGEDAFEVGEPSEQWYDYQGAPTGTEIECEGWRQEAALRMLNNNLDPEVGEKPEELVVYGGTGRAARSWDAYDAIMAELRELGDEETLLVQSGKPVGLRAREAFVTIRSEYLRGVSAQFAEAGIELPENW